MCSSMKAASRSRSTMTLDDGSGIIDCVLYSAFLDLRLTGQNRLQHQDIVVAGRGDDECSLDELLSLHVREVIVVTVASLRLRPHSARPVRSPPRRPRFRPPPPATRSRTPRPHRRGFFVHATGSSSRGPVHCLSRPPKSRTRSIRVRYPIALSWFATYRASASVS